MLTVLWHLSIKLSKLCNLSLHLLDQHKMSDSGLVKSKSATIYPVD